MSKILVNQTGSDVIVQDAGVTVQVGVPYTVPPEDYAKFAASSDVIRELSLGNLLLNDGGNDISALSDAVDIIKGWPVQQAQAEETDFFFDYDDIPVGAGPHTILEYTVGLGEELLLKGVSYDCRIESRLVVFKNGNLIASLRTGAAQPMSSFFWAQNNLCVENDFIEIILTKRSGAPDTDVGVHLQGVTRIT